MLKLKLTETHCTEEAKTEETEAVQVEESLDQDMTEGSAEDTPQPEDDTQDQAVSDGETPDENQDDRTIVSMLNTDDAAVAWDRLNAMSATDLDRGIAMGLFGSASGRVFRMAVAIRVARRHEMTEAQLTDLTQTTQAQNALVEALHAEAAQAKQAAMVASGVGIGAIALSLIALVVAFGVFG